MPNRPKTKPRPWVVQRDSKGVKAQSTNNNNFKEMTSFYNSSRWRGIRSYWIKRNPLCIECSRIGRVVAATVVDHRIPIRQGGDMYSEKNLQSMCTSCHDKKSRRERDTIVYTQQNMVP